MNRGSQAPRYVIITLNETLGLLIGLHLYSRSGDLLLLKQHDTTVPALCALSSTSVPFERISLLLRTANTSTYLNYSLPPNTTVRISICVLFRTNVRNARRLAL